MLLPFLYGRDLKTLTPLSCSETYNNIRIKTNDPTEALKFVLRILKSSIDPRDIQLHLPGRMRSPLSHHNYRTYRGVYKVSTHLSNPEEARHIFVNTPIPSSFSRGIVQPDCIEIRWGSHGSADSSGPYIHLGDQSSYIQARDPSGQLHHVNPPLSSFRKPLIETDFKTSPFSAAFFPDDNLQISQVVSIISPLLSPTKETLLTEKIFGSYDFHLSPSRRGPEWFLDIRDPERLGIRGQVLPGGSLLSKIERLGNLGIPPGRTVFSSHSYHNIHYLLSKGFAHIVIYSSVPFEAEPSEENVLINFFPPYYGSRSPYTYSSRLGRGPEEIRIFPCGPTPIPEQLQVAGCWSLEEEFFQRSILDKI